MKKNKSNKKILWVKDKGETEEISKEFLKEKLGNERSRGMTYLILSSSRLEIHRRGLSKVVRIPKK